MTLRVVTLAKLAAQAEGVRLKALAKRQGMRGAYGAVAAVFGLLLLVMLHISIFEFLVPAVGGGFAALIVVGIDVLMIVIFGVLAARDTPSQTEREAALISRQARGQISDAVSTFTVLTPVARIVGGKGLRGALVSAAATRWLTNRRRR